MATKAHRAEDLTKARLDLAQAKANLDLAQSIRDGAPASSFTQGAIPGRDLDTAKRRWWNHRPPSTIAQRIFASIAKR